MYKLTEEQRKKLINYFAQKPYMESATIIAMLASLEKIENINTANKLSLESTKEGREKIANLAIQKRNNAKNDLS